jgi:hypothetical protein
MLRPLLAAACAALLAVLVFVDLPGDLIYLEVLQNWGHAPAAGLIALVTLYWLCGGRGANPYRWPRTREYFLAGGIAMGLGIAVEVAQSFIGRDAEVGDAVQDALGVVATLSVHAWLFRQRLKLPAGARAALIALAAITTLWATAPVAECAAAYWHRARLFPVLADFRSPRDLYFIRVVAPPVERVLHATGVPGLGDEPTLRVPYGDHPWPGVVIDEPQPDWSAFHNLAVDVSNPNSSALAMLLTVHDRAYIGGKEDRYDRHFTVAANQRLVLKTPLSDILRGPRGRKLNLREIGRMAVVQESWSPQPAFYLNRVWLE